MAPVTAADLGDASGAQGSDDDSSSSEQDAAEQVTPSAVLQRVCASVDLEMGYGGAPDAPYAPPQYCRVCVAASMVVEQWKQAQLYACACCGVHQPYDGVRRVPADPEMLLVLRVDGPKSELVPRHACTTCEIAGVQYCLEPSAVFGEFDANAPPRWVGRTGSRLEG
jgi:hypothetical protein